MEQTNSSKNYIFTIQDSTLTEIEQGSNFKVESRSDFDLVLPEGITKIAGRLFSGQYLCRWIQSIEIPEGVTTIEAGAFSGLISLRNVTFPETLLEIGERAFALCKELKRIKIPASCKKIKSLAFAECSNLNYAIVPETFTAGELEIAEDAFENCKKLTITVNEKDTYLKIENNILKEVYEFAEALIQIPDGVVKIEPDAFSLCSKVQIIEIPKSVTQIEYLACLENVREFRVAKESSVFYTVDGILYDKNNRLVRCPTLKEGTIKVQEGTSVIEENAFYHCTKITNVDLPDSLQYIKSSAFDGCVNLNDINLPENLLEIDSCAFAGCGITSIKVPSKINKIYDSTFLMCEKLQSVELPDSIQFLGDAAFCYCKSLEKINIPLNIDYIAEDAFEGCEKINRKK